MPQRPACGASRCCGHSGGSLSVWPCCEEEADESEGWLLRRSSTRAAARSLLSVTCSPLVPACKACSTRRPRSEGAGIWQDAAGRAQALRHDHRPVLPKQCRAWVTHRLGKSARLWGLVEEAGSPNSFHSPSRSSTVRSWGFSIF